MLRSVCPDRSYSSADHELNLDRVELPPLLRTRREVCLWARIWPVVGPFCHPDANVAPKHGPIKLTNPAAGAGARPPARTS